MAEHTRGRRQSRNSLSNIPRIAHLSFEARPGSKWQEEQRQFLAQRLRILAPIICTIGVLLLFRLQIIFQIAQKFPPIYSAGMACGLLGTFVCAIILFLKKEPSHLFLRRLELFIVGACGLMLFSWGNGWMLKGVVLYGPSPQKIEILLRDAFWIIAPDRITYFRLGPTLINFPLANSASMVTLLYGVFVPNSWKRCASVQGGFLFLCITPLLLALFYSPELRPFLPANIAATIILGGVSSAIGLYSCHKFDLLRRAIFDAKQVGQYRLRKQIGKGAMGEVYLAQHRLLRRTCAIKLIRPEQAGSREALARFEREVQAMAKLTHPNTVEVYDYGHTEDGQLFYAMEYLPGMSLDLLVRTHGPQPPARVIYLLNQVCGALAEAHQQGLIHRDVKPGDHERRNSRLKSGSLKRLTMN